MWLRVRTDPVVPAVRAPRLFGDSPMTKCCCCVLVMLLVVILPAHGQSNYATLTGTVLDAQQLPVSGAAVELTAASTGAVRHAVTNQQGLFEAPALLPDEYELKV